MRKIIATVAALGFLTTTLTPVFAASTAPVGSDISSAKKKMMKKKSMKKKPAKKMMKKEDERACRLRMSRLPRRSR